MGEFFKSNCYFRPLYKHDSLPIYETDEFDFFRCLEFNDSFYYKTVFEMHEGNLRNCSGRYSKIFGKHKISYWADSPQTARAEIKGHGSSNNIMTFWAYDDSSSTFPIRNIDSYLRIVDGRRCGIQELIDKIDQGKEITSEEKKYVEDILKEKPDCLVYDSRAHKGGENYIFIEDGFKKLALRQVKLYLGSRTAKNLQTIICANGSDYSPIVSNYGCYFQEICKVGLSSSFLQSDKYIALEKNYKMSLSKIRACYTEK